VNGAEPEAPSLGGIVARDTLAQAAGRLVILAVGAASIAVTTRAGARARSRGRSAPGRPARLRRSAARTGEPAGPQGRVRFLGAVEDPLPALTESHCLLHCAEREAFGLALVEALAAGRPVAAPAAGGPLEIITPACGRLYAPRDSRSGAAALQELLAGACTPRRPARVPRRSTARLRRAGSPTWSSASSRADPPRTGRALAFRHARGGPSTKTATRRSGPRENC